MNTNKIYKVGDKVYELDESSINKVESTLKAFNKSKYDENGKPSTYYFLILVNEMKRRYGSELRVDQIHDMSATYLGIGRSEMYDLMNYRYSLNDEKLKTEPPVPHIDQQEMERERLHLGARMGREIPPEEFKKHYIKLKSDHLINRPDDVSKNNLSTTIGGVKKYYRSTEEELKKSITTSAKSSLSICLLNEKVDIGKSKIGGLPDLPENIDIPRDLDGNPMKFICQINLEQATTTKGWYDKKGGLISVFMLSQNYQMFAEHDTIKIIYTENISDLIRREGYSIDNILPERKCSFEQKETIPLPPWYLGTQIWHRMNQDGRELYRMAREEYKNTSPSLMGFGYHSEMLYHLKDGKRIVSDGLAGYWPILYLPNFIEDVELFNSSSKGAIMILIKYDDLINNNFSDLSYAYFSY